MPTPSILGIITARGGSKRVPKKNIKELLGKPLLVWSIETGIKSNVFDRFILSTDDPEIMEIGKQAGINVPFQRPAELATDRSTSFDTIKHAVDWLAEHERYAPDWIILLEPCSPGRQPWHIKEVADIINTHGNAIDSVIGISEIPAHYRPEKALVIKENNLVTRADGVLVRDIPHLNQDVPLSYHSNSAIYAFKTKNLYNTTQPSLRGEKTYGYVMDEAYALDIDTPADMDIAEVRMRRIHELNTKTSL